MPLDFLYVQPASVGVLYVQRTYTVWVIYLGAMAGLVVTALHCSRVKLLFGG
jgi:hypothetical protein